MRLLSLLFRSFALLAVVAGRGLSSESGGQRPRAVNPHSVAELAGQIEARVTAARFQSALWGIKIVSLETGRTWFEHHPDRLMSPASNSKLYVAALALDRLGPEYRIATPLVATARPDGAGKINGDLAVCGRGDPGWKSRRTGRSFDDLFTPFVRALQQAGIRRIRGDLVADATFFRGPPNGAGWTADDLEDYYGAEISAVTLEDNYAQMRVTPAASAGAKCELTLVQPHTGLVLDNRTTTAVPGSEGGLATRRIFGEPTVHVFGTLPAGAAAETLDLTVPRPAQWFAGALKEALVRNGIRVDGRARSVRWPDPPAIASGGIPLGDIRSSPLRELIANLMKSSQNLETDLLFAHLGERFRPADAAAWQTSEQCGVIALGDFLRERGLPAEDVRFEEGSGLSRNNLTSANATVALLRFMASHPAGKDFIDALPVAGHDGTLRRRMKGTAGENNIRAKTGTLRWANSLSGFVTTAAGERLVFSLMLNRAVLPKGVSARDELDALALMLATFGGREVF